MKNWKTDLDNMVYIIRNEGLYPLHNIVNEYGREAANTAQKSMLNNLVTLLSDIFSNANIKVADIEKQLEKADRELVGRKTISLDTYFKGTYNLEITRLFKSDENKLRFIEITNRPNTLVIPEQIKSIKPGTYTLVDDDAVGGRTIKSVIRMLPSSVNIDNIYLLMDDYRNKESEPILDVVDCRDFIAGIQGIGLTVQTNIGKMRLPYMLPFVDIDDKANIPEDKKVEVSKKLWGYVAEFWNILDKNATLSDTGQDFMNISKYLGFSPDIPMSSLCERYKLLADMGEILI